MDLKQSFGKRLKELRKNKKMTQFELAEAVEIDEKHLSHIETGRSFPKAALIEKFAETLGVDLDSMFDFSAKINRKLMIETISKNVDKLPDSKLEKMYNLILKYTKE
ncbi:helix-turn-helix transcriptional regulator [bacterium]|nr:helix-turn-helix transcriptional regulator [bacterium]